LSVADFICPGIVTQLQGFATGLVVQLNLRAGFALGRGTLNYPSMTGLDALMALIIGEEQRDNSEIDQVARIRTRASSGCRWHPG
jgi:hypothetical protein